MDSEIWTRSDYLHNGCNDPCIWLAGQQKGQLPLTWLNLMLWWLCRTDKCGSDINMLSTDIMVCFLPGNTCVIGIDIILFSGGWLQWLRFILLKHVSWDCVIHEHTAITKLCQCIFCQSKLSIGRIHIHSGWTDTVPLECWWDCQSYKFGLHHPWEVNIIDLKTLDGNSIFQRTKFREYCMLNT